MKQRILSIALILCMLLSLVHVSVFAATNYELYINNFQFSSTNLTYTSGSGSATYDPGSNTLTIKNLSLSTGGSNTIIESGISGLTMKIDGTLTLNLLASKAPYEVWLSTDTVMLDARSLLSVLSLVGTRAAVVAEDNVDPRSFYKLVNKMA